MTPFVVRDTDTGRLIALNPYQVVAIEQSRDNPQAQESFISYAEPALTINVEGSFEEITAAWDEAMRVRPHRTQPPEPVKTGPNFRADLT